MHYVSDRELDSLRAGSASPSLGLFGVTAGAAITAVVTLATVEMGPLVFGGFVGATIGCTGLSAFFGTMALREYRAIIRQVDEIKAERRGPGS